MFVTNPDSHPIKRGPLAVVNLSLYFGLHGISVSAKARTYTSLLTLTASKIKTLEHHVYFVTEFIRFELVLCKHTI